MSDLFTDYNDKFTIRVCPTGSPFKDFSLPVALIRKRSPFLTAAIDGPWKESKDRVMRFTEASPEAFNIYVYWLCERKYGDCPMEHWLCINKDVLCEGHEPSDPTFGTMESWNLLLECFALGDFLQDLQFKDCVIDQIEDCVICDVEKLPDGYDLWQLVEVIYRHTVRPGVNSTQSPRQLVLDLVIHKLELESFKDIDVVDNAEFTSDLLLVVDLVVGRESRVCTNHAPITIIRE
ncbi:hypothetical protein K490DRAFT_56909 [Saccharata proteae CBS 121410]|uniref:BTB domain-containing protein n=1 Tax=Saccharata proteae CBS 121410 TaxID=1314787 RepID=A0A9P4LYN3_9PEZI|nr:hypothetical protein K490DRAFT_56909 [Saccharata proteae CBS 121410]